MNSPEAAVISPVNSEERTAGANRAAHLEVHQFKKGVSGNPRGRPPKSRNVNAPRYTRKLAIAIHDAAVRYLSWKIVDLLAAFSDSESMSKLRAYEGEALQMVVKAIQGDPFNKRYLHEKILGISPASVTMHEVRTEVFPELQKRLLRGDDPSRVYLWFQQYALELRLESADHDRLILWAKELIVTTTEQRGAFLKQQRVFGQRELERVIQRIKTLLIQFLGDDPVEIRRFGETLRQVLEEELGLKVEDECGC